MTPIELIYSIGFFFVFGLASLAIIMREHKSCKEIDYLAKYVVGVDKQNEDDFVLVDEDDELDVNAGQFVLVAEDDEEQTEALFM